jgi:predicted RNA-binding protein YlxR (DUF448 family)
MCVGCRVREPALGLVRVVRALDGSAVVDATGRAPGRGAWVHPRSACIEAALARGGLARALRAGVGAEVAGRLRELSDGGAGARGRVHELAKALGVSSKELLETLGAMGVTGKSASSSVPEDVVPRLRASGGKATTTPAKPREVLEPPPAPRKAKPKAKPKAKTEPKTEPGSVLTATAPALVAAEEPAKVEEPKEAKPRRRPVEEPAVPTGPVLQVIHGATPQTIGEKTNRSPAEIVKVLFLAGEMVTATTSLNDEAIELIAAELGYTADIIGLEDELKPRRSRGRR